MRSFSNLLLSSVSYRKAEWISERIKAPHPTPFPYNGKGAIGGGY